VACSIYVQFADSDISTFLDMGSRDVVCTVTPRKQKSPVPFGKEIWQEPELV